MPVLPKVFQLLGTKEFRRILHTKHTFEVNFGGFKDFRLLPNGTTIVRQLGEYLQECGILVSRCESNAVVGLCLPNGAGAPRHQQDLFDIYSQGLDVCVSQIPTSCAKLDSLALAG